MQQIITKKKYNPIQKTILIGFSLIFFLIGGFYFLLLILHLLAGKINEIDFTPGFIVGLLVFFPSIYLFIRAFHTIGILYTNTEIYQATFLFKKVINKELINREGIKGITLLMFNMHTKTAFGTSLNPDQTISEGEIRVYGLNETHSKRTLITTCTSSKIAKQIISLFEEQFSIPFVKYAPPASKRRRRNRK
jgi:hypothetical protein